MEQQEREDEAAGAKIAVKKKKGKGKSSGRQTKLTSDGAASSSNSLKITKPSAFAEPIDPRIPEFNAQPKKARAKKEPGAGKALKTEGRTSAKSAGKSPEKKAAVKSIKEAFGIDDDEAEIPPLSLMERVAAKKPSKQSTLKFTKAPVPKRQKKAEKDVLELDDDDSDDEGDFMDYDTPPPARQMPTRKKVE